MRGIIPAQVWWFGTRPENVPGGDVRAHGGRWLRAALVGDAVGRLVARCSRAGLEVLVPGHGGGLASARDPPSGARCGLVRTD